MPRESTSQSNWLNNFCFFFHFNSLGHAGKLSLSGFVIFYFRQSQMLCFILADILFFSGGVSVESAWISCICFTCLFLRLEALLLRSVSVLWIRKWSPHLKAKLTLQCNTCTQQFREVKQHCIHRDFQIYIGCCPGTLL